MARHLTLRGGYLAVAAKLQEAADLSANDICTRLRDTITDTFRGTGVWAYYIDHIGDSASGQVIYSVDSDIKRAPYTITETAGAAKCTVDTQAAEDVIPRTVYEVEAAESAKPTNAGLKLVESAATTETIVLREARADYEIKLIAPGKGSTAFYPAEVLKRDGPKVFSAGTHVYLNHPTAAEEAQRPEGDVANLAGVLTTTATYHESHPKGEGLYARMKVFADHAQMVEEKAAHVGMSIRASGHALAEAGRVVIKDGVPVLASLTAADSVDVVTRAGAGGMILTEAARTANPIQEVGVVTADEAKQLIESAVTAATAPLRERAIREDARTEAATVLAGVSLPAAAKTRIIERVVATVPRTADGVLDVAKLRESLVAEAKAEGEYIASLTGSGRVVGMGTAPVMDPQESARREAQQKSEDETALRVFESLMGNKEAAAIAVKGRAS
jgi:hypothetical protein